MPLASSSSGECVFSVRLEAMFLTMFDLPPVGVTPRSPVRSCVFKFSAGSCVDPLGVFVSIYGRRGHSTVNGLGRFGPEDLRLEVARRPE